MISQMLSSSSSEEEEEDSQQSPIRRISPSSSSELVSSISSSSSSLAHNPNQHQPPRTMEDVWKDISLSSFPETPSSSSLHHQSHHNPIRTTATTTTTAAGAATFQDFLGRPFTHHHHHNGVRIMPQPATRSHTNNNATTSSTTIFFGSLNNNSASSSTSSPSHQQHPATALSLNTATEFRYIIGRPSHNGLINPNPISYLPSPSNPFESLGSSFGKNGFPSSGESSSTITITPTNPAERKHKRLIKNRESAARSRARKQQAYTTELEHTIEELREENRRLMDQQRELCQATQTQLPKKRGLQRSSTASF